MSASACTRCMPVLVDIRNSGAQSLIMHDIVVKTFLCFFYFSIKACFLFFLIFQCFLFTKYSVPYAESLSCYILICNSIRFRLTSRLSNTIILDCNNYVLQVA